MSVKVGAINPMLQNYFQDNVAYFFSKHINKSNCPCQKKNTLMKSVLMKKEYSKNISFLGV